MNLELPFTRSLLSTAVLAATLTLTGCLGSDSDDDSDGDTAVGETGAGSWQAATASPGLTPDSGAVYWDLETNSIVTEYDDWELKVEKSGYSTVYSLNGGASGSGQAAIVGSDKAGDAQGVGALLADSVWDVTDPTDTSQVYKYFTDSSEGAFNAPGDFGALEYGAAGGHDMWPTFAVYLIDDDEGNHHKVQVLSNTGENGDLSSASLFVRYADAATGAVEKTIGLDATGGTAVGLDLSGDITVADTATNTAWDMAYQKYVGFSLNASAKACVAYQYDALYDADGNPVAAEFEKLNAANTLAEFDAVKADDCVTAADAVKTLTPSSGWYDYDSTTHIVTVHDKGDSNGWIVKSADGNAYGRIHFSSYSPLTLQVEQWKAAE